MTNSEVVARLYREASGAIDEQRLDWWIQNGWSPEITWHAIEGAPDDVGLIRGTERLRRYFLELLELFEEIVVDLRELRDIGEKVVARVLLTARSRSTGMPVEIDFAVVYDLDATGRIAAGHEYKTEAEAVRAAETAMGQHESAARS